MSIFKDRSGDWCMWTFFALVFCWVPPLLLGIMFVGECGGANGHHTGYVTAVESRVNVTWNSDVVYFKSSAESTQEACIASATRNCGGGWNGTRGRNSW